LYFVLVGTYLTTLFDQADRWPGLLQGLQLQQFVSEDSGLDEASVGKYDLLGVSNHFGNLVGGHYTAVCKVPESNGSQDQWIEYNDERVTKLSASSVASATAYILCYCRKQ
jgi:ubiquitin C-terminal hydrolase